MEGVLKRLDAVESTVLEIKSQVDGITATLPQLATKDDVTAVRVEVSDARGEIGKIAAIITYLATKADLSEEIGRVMGAIRASEIATIKWTIGIIIAVAGLAFTIGKYGH